MAEFTPEPSLNLALLSNMRANQLDHLITTRAAAGSAVMLTEAISSAVNNLIDHPQDAPMTINDIRMMLTIYDAQTEYAFTPLPPLLSDGKLFTQ